jgi:hypothetical protein
MSKGCPCLLCHESYLIISTGMKDPSLQPVLDIIPHAPLFGRPSLDHDSLGVHHYNETLPAMNHMASSLSTGINVY